jgi:hypothetical protein
MTINGGPSAPQTFWETIMVSLKSDNTLYWYDAHLRLSRDYSALERRAYDMRDALERALVALKLSTPKTDQIELKLRHDAAIIQIEQALREAQP